MDDVRRRQLRKKASMDAGAYLGPYSFEDGKLSLAGPLEIMVMPQYQGRGRGGKRIVDKRSGKVRPFPMIVHDRRSAQSSAPEGSAGCCVSTIER